MALGRGLSSLIQSTYDSGEEGNRDKQGTSHQHVVLSIPVHHIQPHINQPRTYFNEQALQDLACSIKEDGVLQPIIVFRLQNAVGEIRYQIIAGERRWRAAKMVGLEVIPVIVRTEVDQREHLRIAILENIQRENLNPIELGRAYKRFAEECHMRQEDIAARVGKSRQVVGNTIRLLSLPQIIQDDMIAGNLSENHARSILALDSDEDRLRLWKEIHTHQLSARQTEVNARAYKKKSSRSSPAKDPLIKQFAMQLEAYLETKVSIEQGSATSNGGSIIITYFARKDLEHIVKKIQKS